MDRDRDTKGGYLEEDQGPEARAVRNTACHGASQARGALQGGREAKRA